MPRHADSVTADDESEQDEATARPRREHTERRHADHDEIGSPYAVEDDQRSTQGYQQKRSAVGIHREPSSAIGLWGERGGVDHVDKDASRRERECDEQVRAHAPPM